MSKRILIIGGVAGGATAAARIRRLDENAEIIMIERGTDVSFANCGLPYHIGGEISARQALIVQSKEALAKRFRLVTLASYLPGAPALLLYRRGAAAKAASIAASTVSTSAASRPG